MTMCADPSASAIDLLSNRRASTAGWLDSLGRTPVPGIFEKAMRARPLVLVYHGLHDALGLRRQIAFLVSRYRVVHLDTLVGILEAGLTPPHGCAAVTFDDGLRSVFSVAFPILHDYGCPATVFVNTSAVSSGIPIWPVQIQRMVQATPLSSIRLAIDGATYEFHTRTPVEKAETAAQLIRRCEEDWQPLGNEALELVADATASSPLSGAPLSENEAPAAWGELARMESSGLVRIGNHTHSHRILPSLDDVALRQELLESHCLLEEHTVRPSRVFCYPNGDADPRAERVLSATGYIGAVTTVQRRVAKGTPAMRVPRIGAHDFESLAAFRMRASGALTPARYAFDLVQAVRGRGSIAAHSAGSPS